MLIEPPPRFRKDRRRVKSPSAVPTPPPPGLGPVLVGTRYDPDGFTIQLAFDQAIVITGLNGAVITVNDPDAAALYEATGQAQLADARTVVIGLVSEGSSSGSQLVLNAGAGNGIVAQAGGGEWAGVDNYPLT
jgi:hypothetical protein